MICVILADGFEEMEAVAPIDLLRRSGHDVKTVSIMKEKCVIGGHGIPVTADLLLSEVDRSVVQMAVLPGGLQGVENMKNSPELADFLKKIDAEKRFIAAICAAPTYLSDMGLLKGAHAVCYPDMGKQLTDGVFCRDETVVREGRIITGQAAGSATEFGLKLIEVLDGWEKMEKVRKAICFTSHVKGLD